MARPKKERNMDEIMEKHRDLEIDQMPLDTYEDYLNYNDRARLLNKKAKACIYPIKQCPPELHPKERVIVSWANGSVNPIPVFLSDDKIHYDEKLTPGKPYDLPTYIVRYLADKGTASWKVVDNADGSRDTVISHKNPRFSIRSVYA